MYLTPEEEERIIRRLKSMSEAEKERELSTNEQIMRWFWKFFRDIAKRIAEEILIATMKNWLGF